MTNRRQFLQALAAFTAAAVVAPKIIIARPSIDWSDWVNIELDYKDGAVTTLRINQLDYTDDIEARARLASMVHVQHDSVRFGKQLGKQFWGTEFRLRLELQQWLPDQFTIGFSYKDTTDGPPSIGVNGNLFQLLPEHEIIQHHLK